MFGTLRYEVRPQFPKATNIFDTYGDLCMGEERGCIGSWWGNRRERVHWGDLGVDGWIN